MTKNNSNEIVSREQLDEYVREAAEAAGYPGFGAESCDLGQSIWWAAYTRQSREEQAKNNRLPEYLLTCARMAKDKGVVVPREYVLVDHESSEYLDRKHMSHLRNDLIAGRKISGVLIPLQGRLTADAAQQSIFERGCSYYGVEMVFGDAPSGSDWASQTSRMIMAQAQQLRLKTNRDNVRAGNIGRVLKGMVPACGAAYGYRYCRDAEIGPDGRVHIKAAWWEVNELDPDGEPIEGSPAWVVVQIFQWVASEERTFYWVAAKLNEMGIKAPEGGKWSMSRVSHIAHRHCYVGEHAYNANSRVPNPDRPLGEATAQIQRTLLRPKPEKEWIRFQVPRLISETLWQKANAIISQRGRGRGKEGKAIQALLRNRIFCPRCGRPMAVRRYKRREERTYYFCSRYFRPSAKEPCSYSRFVPSTWWDDHVWDVARALLEDDAWLEVELASKQSGDKSASKVVRLQELKISQAKGKITKIRDGYERDVYSIEEAQRRINEYEGVIAKAGLDIQRLQKRIASPEMTEADLKALKDRLTTLRSRNLDSATFEEKREVIVRLGIKVHPSEDFKSVRIACGLNVQSDGDSHSGGNDDCRKVLLGPPCAIHTGTSARYA